MILKYFLHLIDMIDDSEKMRGNTQLLVLEIVGMQFV